MKLLLASIAILLFSFSVPWEADFVKAKQTAAAEHKYILLNFSGSDWCVPCIRMHKEIFGNEAFTAYANASLVLVNADFPRQKKNMPDKEKQKQNEWLADKYNPTGNFPFTLLMDAGGKVLKSWDGFPDGGAAAFTEDIRKYIDTAK